MKRARRLPLALALLPLLLAVGGYALWWDRERDALRPEIGGWLPSGTQFRTGGFPYRLTAEAGAVAQDLMVADARIGLAATRWVVERQPWRQSLSVIGAEAPRVRLASEALPGLALDVRAARGRASLNPGAERLSAEFDGATVALAGLLPAFRAERFEMHVRLPAGAGAGTAPRALRAEVFARGEGVRAGAATIGFVMDAAVLSPAPIRSAAGWRDGGGLFEIRSLSVSDGTGELAMLRGLVTPDAGGLGFTGSVVTTCPRQFAALFGGPAAPPTEYRARKPVTLALGGTAARPVLARPLPAVIPVREREGPCPRLGGAG